MAHFAQIENGIVQTVIVVSNDDCAGGDFPASEVAGQAFIASIGLEGQWLQTSYNNNFRRAYAGKGFFYSATKDVFYEPQPFPSWSLNDDCYWQPPTPKPTTEGEWMWNEGLLKWEN